MGKIFLDHIGGTRLFSCAACDVNLTNRSELISTRFTGATVKNNVNSRAEIISTHIASLLDWADRTIVPSAQGAVATAECRAFLFHKVVNLVYSEVQDRVMLTGRHMVRDVSCKNCATKLGWVYEFATEENQRYKEGRVILERALVTETDGIEEIPVNNDD